MTKERRAIMLYGLLISASLSLAYIYWPAFFTNFSYRVYDAMVRTHSGQPSEDAPVVVDIDEQSLDAFGQWPWPRYRIALLLNKLTDAGVRSIGVDIIFSEPDRTSLGVLQKEISRELNIAFSFEGLPERLYDNDTMLVESIRNSPAVLGYKFLFDAPETRAPGCVPPPLKAVTLRKNAEETDFAQAFEAEAAGCSLTRFTEAAAASGFLNYIADDDGAIRRTPLIMRFQDQWRPSLSLAALILAMDVETAVVRVTGHGVESIELQNMRIPLDAQGNLLLRFRGGKGSFDYVSALDVLKDRVDPERIAGKIVFLGTSAAGLEGTHPTPFDIRYPGVEVHATVADNILKGDFLARPHWVRGSEFASLILAGLLTAAALVWLPGFRSVLFLGLVIACIWYASSAAFEMKGFFLSPCLPTISIILNFSALTFLKFLFDEIRIKEQNAELLKTQDFTIFSLLSLVETRDNETGEHIIRTQNYVRILAENLVRHPRFSAFLDAKTITFLFKSAPLHDIGKVGVPDAILKKPGKLTPEEFEEMKKHTVYGKRAIVNAERALNASNTSSFLRHAKDITCSHHEKWDGSGYPQGLAGDDIPISGRLMALADVYDALTSKRVYKPPFTHGAARDIILAGRGKHFDPDVVDAFLEIETDFENISTTLKDAE